MSSVKPRVPGSFPEACAAIRDELGADICAAIIGKSAGRVNAACDADAANYSPYSLTQALALDAEYVRLTGRPAPIWRAYGAKLTDVEVCTRQDPVADMASVSDVSNRVIQSVRSAIDPDGHGGTDIEPREALDIVRALDAAEREIATQRAKYARLAGINPNVRPAALREVS